MTALPAADTPWGDGINIIRAFLRGLPPEYRRVTLFRALLNEVNRGVPAHPGDVKHPSAKDYQTTEAT